MKITDVKTFLMHVGPPPPAEPNARRGGAWSSRNWLFVKVYTDGGIYARRHDPDQ